MARRQMIDERFRLLTNVEHGHSVHVHSKLAYELEVEEVWDKANTVTLLDIRIIKGGHKNGRITKRDVLRQAEAVAAQCEGLFPAKSEDPRRVDRLSGWLAVDRARSPDKAALGRRTKNATYGSNMFPHVRLCANDFATRKFWNHIGVEQVADIGDGRKIHHRQGIGLGNARSDIASDAGEPGEHVRPSNFQGAPRIELHAACKPAAPSQRRAVR